MHNNVNQSSNETRGKTMKTIWRKSVTRLAAAVGALTLVGGLGCVEPVKELNRVQPNYVKKDVFDGEWYVRGTVVDKDYLASYPFIGWEGSIDRIRWEISENFLNGYRSYENVPGTAADTASDDYLLAQYRITHFDIRRDYNRNNGVESNVIVENTNDRPWWERDYIRVDWAYNYADDVDVNGYVNFLYGGRVADNANSQPSDPWKVRIEDSEGDGEIDYIETTFHAMAHASGAACYYMANEASSCPAAEVRMKLSYMKVPEKQYETKNYPDFEPVLFGCRVGANLQVELCFEGDSGCHSCNCDPSAPDPEGASCRETDPDELWIANGPFGSEICDPAYHDPDNCFQFTTPVFSKFGYFRTDRFLFDRENGYSYRGRERLINRWDIWKDEFDAEGNLLPYADREVEPIVYHLNVGFPENLIPATEELANDWDEAFRETVAKLQGKDMADVPRMYEMRVNDCNVDNLNEYMDEYEARHDFRGDLSREGIGELGAGNLENACAVVEHYGRELNDPLIPPFRWQQLGDLRYSFLNWISKPDIAGPLGYGPSAADPLTGEIVSANANIYGASLDTYANWGGDIVDLLNGRITTEDVMNGTHVREHIESVRDRYRDKSMSQESIGKYIKLFDDRTAGFSDETYLKEVPLARLNEQFDRLRETGFEKENLITTDMLILMNPQAQLDPGMDLSAQMTDEMVERAMPSRWARNTVPSMVRFNANQAASSSNSVMDLDPSDISIQEMQQRKQEFFAEIKACFQEEMVEPAIADLAFDLADRPREEVVQFIRSAIYRAVMAHEVGHTLGLRHNFEGSADSLNYFPGWWGVETGDHRDSHSARDSELMYSSIMDYHQRFNSDFGGIGLYDRAAIKFGYGDLVEVFDEGRYDPSLGGYEDPFVPRDWDTSFGLFSPTDVPYLLAGGTANDLINSHYDTVIDDLLAGNENAHLDIQSLNIQPNAANIYKRKNISWREFERQEVLRIFGLDNDDGSPPLTEVPYSYCSDMYAWGGNLTCNRYDMGATSQEIVNNAAEMYEFYYPFNAFRGHRMWNTNPLGSYMNRLYDRTYQPMLNAFRYFYFFRRSTASIWPLIRDWSAASFVGSNFFARVLQAPEPGRYCLEGDMYVPEQSISDPSMCDTGSTFNLGLGDGRYFDSRYTNEYLYNPQNIGHLYDKLIAIQSLTSSNAFFQRDFSSFLSRGAFSIGYYRVFQPEMVNLFRGIMMGDNSSYSGEVVINGKPELVYKPFISLPGEEFQTVGTKIKPSDSYYMRYYAVFFGFANLSSQIDRTLDFSERARISLLGASNDPITDPSVNVEAITWHDPISLYTYNATATDGPDISIGYQLLMDAKVFTNDGTDGEPEGEWYVAMTELEDARAALEAAQANGTTDLADLVDAVELAQINMDRRDRLLNEKVQIIDTVRQLSDALEFGQ
jgi:hypothetical protein